MWLNRTEIDRYFLNIENLRTLNVFMGLNISLYKETIGEKNDLCNPAIPNIWQLKLNAALRNAFPKRLNELTYNKRSLVQTLVAF